MTERRLGPVELLVMAPIGAGLLVRDEGPQLVARCIDRGRETVERQIVTARGTGQLVVAFGVPMVKQKIVGLLDRRPAESEAPPESVVEPVPSPVAPPADGPAAATLPISSYDALSASQVVEHLDGLGLDDLAAIREYETAHRGRRTILGRIEQLAG